MDFKGSHKVTNLGQPVSDGDAASRKYVNHHQPVTIAERNSVSATIGPIDMSFIVPPTMNGSYLRDKILSVHQPGEGGIEMRVQIMRKRGIDIVPMLMIPISLMGGEDYSTNGEIEPSAAQVQPGDRIYLQVEEIHDIIPAQGTGVTLIFGV